MSETPDRNRFTGLLRGKSVVLAITASISIYRMPDLIRDLRREGADVHVGMSREAAGLISPKVMEWASGNRVVTELSGDIEHISFFSGYPANTGLVVSPCTHNMIGKMSSGISDDVPSAFFSFAIGNRNPILVSPAMHEGMYTNPANERNLAFLASKGVEIAPPDITEEKAKLSSSSDMLDSICKMFHRDLKGKRVLIIGGYTREPIDSVRSIANHSTGFTAYWIARNAFRLGASEITYIGNCILPLPSYVNHHEASTSAEIQEIGSREAGKGYDLVLIPAAISDYRIKEKFKGKLSSKDPVTLTLVPGPKVIDEVRKAHKGVLVAFSLKEGLGNRDVIDLFSGSRPELIVSDSASGKGSFGPIILDYNIIGTDREYRLRSVSKPEMTLELLKKAAVLVGR